ncbi:MAG: site-specific DNA-methyltransferase [Treponema sp.]|nr:site-specific DNA-methyltransferase [Treponema sp.]
MTLETEQQYKNKIAELEDEIKRLKEKETKKIKNTKYGLNWIDVPEAFEDKSKNAIPILEEVKEKSIKNNDGKPTHILIEGDNFHALTCLNYTHAGKIDVIYIDPPYNTGNTEEDQFVYRDERFIKEFPNGMPVPKEHPLRHSYWLSFMAKRLKLAKNLLSNKGILFISIDDNEQANLRLLCDEIFGESSFVTTLHVEMSATQGMKVKAAQKGNIVKNAEYILIYTKDGHKDIARNLLYDFRPDYDDHYSKMIKENKLVNLKDEFQKYFPKESISKLSDAYENNKLFRDFVEKNIDNIFADDKISGFDITDYKEGLVYKVSGKDRFYYIYNNGSKIRQLLPLSASFGLCDDFRKNYGLRKIRGDWWKDFYKDMGNVSKEGGIVYKNGKKPVRLIQQLIYMSSKKDSIILDFFGGSGTTTHACILANQDDNGNRQSILCQAQENNKICEKTTYQRICNIENGYKPENSKNEVSGLGNSLKYFRTTFVGKNNAETATDSDRIILSQKAGTLISLSENTLEEIEATNSYQIYTNGKRYTAIYFTEDLSDFPKFVEEVENKNAPTSVFVFTWGSPDIFENEFTDLKNITIKAIPKPILEIYKSLNGGL